MGLGRGTGGTGYAYPAGGDGDTDLAITNRCDESVSVLLNFTTRLPRGAKKAHPDAPRRGWAG
jgi:hypothetical protein